MRNVRLWRELLGVDQRTVIEGIEVEEFEEEDADGDTLVVARVRPRSGVSRRCGRCGCRAPWYDRGEGRRRWRGLDWGTVQVVLEADAPRVNCPSHGPTVVAVPWARHHAGHTLAFDDTVAWLAVACSKTAVCELMRVAWRTVGAIVARVWADTEMSIDRFGGLRRIGIDEISYKRHHKYLTVVVDHDSGRLVWAAPGRDTKTLRRFFDALGSERCAQITHVSADAADWRVWSPDLAPLWPLFVTNSGPVGVVIIPGRVGAVCRHQCWPHPRSDRSCRPSSLSVAVREVSQDAVTRGTVREDQERPPAR